jgi:hypothetical protein
MTLSEGDWARLVEEWRTSRQTARAFASARGVTDSALRYWAARLARGKRSTSPTRSRPAGRPTTAAAAPPLARVVRPGEATPTGDGRITIVVGKVSIVVERGFDGAHLREVVRVLCEGG